MCNILYLHISLLQFCLVFLCGFEFLSDISSFPSEGLHLAFLEVLFSWQQMFSILLYLKKSLFIFIFWGMFSTRYRTVNFSFSTRQILLLCTLILVVFKENWPLFIYFPHLSSVLFSWLLLRFFTYLWIKQFDHSMPSSAFLSFFFFFLVFLSFMNLCVLSHFSRVWLCTTPWTVARQAPLSMGFSRQEYWSALPCLFQGIFPAQRLNPRVLPSSLMSPALAGGFFTTSGTWEALVNL